MHLSTQGQYYCGRMDDYARETHMLHFQCETCGITATCVDTPSATLAWLDHMDNHAVKTGYRRWTWTVTPLPLGQGDGE
jgi:hypothetical protein